SVTRRSARKFVKKLIRTGTREARGTPSHRLPDYATALGCADLGAVLSSLLYNGRHSSFLSLCSTCLTNPLLTPYAPLWKLMLTPTPGNRWRRRRLFERSSPGPTEASRRGSH